MWLKKSDRYFCKIDNFVYGKSNARGYSKPSPQVIKFGNEVLWNLAILILISYWPAASIVRRKANHDDTAVAEVRRTLVQD